MDMRDARSIRPIPIHIFHGMLSPKTAIARRGARTGLKKKTSAPCMADVASIPMKKQA
jgi:hypothetical protein